MPKEKQQAKAFIDPEERQKQLIEERRIKENKIVRGRFEYKEVKNGHLNFAYRKFKKDGIREYTLVDDQVYELPLGVAIHLNKSGKYPIHHHTKDKDGNTVSSVGSFESRYSFHSLDFTDISDSDSLDAMGPSPLI